MSWDAAVFRTRTRSYVSFDPADIDPIPVDVVRDAICTEFPNTDISDPEWMVFDNDKASVIFSITPDQYISLNIHLVEDDYEAELIKQIRRFANKLGCRIFDFTQFEYI